jgi:oligopeptidase B
MKFPFTFATLTSALALTAMLTACQSGTEQQQAATATISYTPKSQSDYPAPPQAGAKPQEFGEHGYKRVDNYYWLRDKANPEVIKYLEAENAYCDTVMRHTTALQDTLFREMRGRIKEDDRSVPVLDNGYYYYSRTEKDKQYSTQYRRKGSMDAPEELLIDGNKMAQDKPYFGLGGMEVSNDNQIMAYSYNFTGSYAEYDLHFRNLATGQELPDELKGTSGFAFANDNKTVFYTKPDKALRSYRLYRHVVGTPVAQDKLLYEEKDEMFRIYVGRTKSKAFLVLYIGSTTTSEMRLLDANQPTGEFKMFSQRQKDTEYYIDHHPSKFIVRYKDRQNLNYKLMEAPLQGYEDRSKWKDVIAYDPNVRIEGFDLFANYMVISARTKGLLELRIMDLARAKIAPISFPEPVYSVYNGGNPEFNGTTVRYVYTSLNRPTTTYEYDMATGQSKVLKVREIPSGFNPDGYEVKRLFAKAADGVEVPISLVHKKGLKLDGTNPAYLYSYGSYGSSTDAGFNANLYSLIDRGFVYALAHIRGGSDLGEQWYEDGKLMKKKNTFTDFIACAEFLVKEKYTAPEKLAISGGSAGGLLMGAVVNLRPDLFKVVVAEVPFVDVINTMLDTSLPLTVGEYEEWGNPNEKAAYDYMLSYSPYDNVGKKNYPNILATAGINDTQVSYHEPAKWVAKLREMKTDQNLILLKTNMGAGHGGSSGRFDYLKEEAFQYAFVLDRLGMK